MIVEFDFDWCDFFTERCPNPFPTRFGGSERFFLPFLKKYFTFYGPCRGSKIEDFQRIFLYTELGSIFGFQEEDMSCWMDLVNSLVYGECCCVSNWRYFFEDVGGVKNFSRGGKKLVNMMSVNRKTVFKCRGWVLISSGWSWVEKKSWRTLKVFYPLPQVFYPIYVSKKLVQWDKRHRT